MKTWLPRRSAAGGSFRRFDVEWAGFAVSAVLHVVILAIALLSFGTVKLQAPPPEAIIVELVDEPVAESNTDGKQASEPPLATPPPRQPDVVAMPRTSPLPLASAQRIFSGAALDVIAQRSLSTLAGNARLEQLCNVEAMEQIVHAGGRYAPQRVIAYLTSEAQMDGETLVAYGAAFLSEGHWYELAYRCRPAHDRRTIIAFDFATGEQIDDDYPGLPSSGDGD